jgi:Subtilase family
VRREANWAFDSLVDGEHVVVAEDDREHVHSVIWVGASMQNDRKWPRSNYGPLIDLFAPGDAIQSAANGHDAAFRMDSGTSFVSHDNQGTLIKTNSPTTLCAQAAPHVTGIIACLLSDPLYTGLTPAEMKHKILEMAWPNQVEGGTHFCNGLNSPLSHRRRLLYSDCSRPAPACFVEG